MAAAALITFGENLSPAPEVDSELKRSINTLYLGGIDSVSGNFTT